MASPRYLLPDGPFHVMCKAVAGGVLFSDDADREHYLDLLQRTVERHGWKVLTFALMGTHLHMLVWTPTSRMSAGMWWLNWQYAEWFKACNAGHIGHVFANRYTSKPITDDAYLLAVVRYVAVNPVRANMVSSASEYAWSADKLIRSGALNPRFLAIKDTLALFGGDPAAYAAFVDGEDPPAHDLVVRAVEKPSDDRPPLDDLLADPTDAALVAAYRQWGYTLQEVADHLGVHNSTVSRRIRRV